MLARTRFPIYPLNGGFSNDSTRLNEIRSTRSLRQRHFFLFLMLRDNLGVDFFASIKARKGFSPGLEVVTPFSFGFAVLFFGVNLFRKIAYTALKLLEF